MEANFSSLILRYKIIVFTCQLLLSFFFCFGTLFHICYVCFKSHAVFYLLRTALTERVINANLTEVVEKGEWLVREWVMG